MRLTGAEIIIKLLERQGIGTVAGIPGGMNLPLYDALYKSRIRHILVRHEQAAGFIAQGMARSTGKTAVCFATSGPGATNLLTAIADARLDSIPLVAVTGQVASSLIGTDAFQEIDIYGMSLPVTKHNFLVRSARELLTVIPEAFVIASSGRPGPVLVDVPKDVQNESIDLDGWPEPGRADGAVMTDRFLVERAAAMISGARRPVLYAGGGIIHAGAHDALTALARKNSIPVALTLMGLGCFPPDDPLYLGMLGMHGSRTANGILEEADLLIAAGVRFDDRATGALAQFCPRAGVIHIDIDHAEIGKLKTAHLALHGDCAGILGRLAETVEIDPRPGWSRRAAGRKEEVLVAAAGDGNLTEPASLIDAISVLAGPDSIITTDVGQHQMWTAQRYPVRRPRSLLTSGGLGTMGFGLPAAIGAALANPGRRVVCISGDGSILMNIQELATLAELDLDVTVIVCNNGHLGLVRQQQELFYGGRYIASRFESAPDFAAIARGFGIRAVSLDGERARAALREALSRPGPSLVNAPIRADANVLPMVPPGGANRDMIGGTAND